MNQKELSYMLKLKARYGNKKWNQMTPQERHAWNLLNRQEKLVTMAEEMFQLLKDIDRDCPMYASPNDLLKNHNRASDLVLIIEEEK